MRSSAYGMLLDRGLTLEQLEAARLVSIADPHIKTNRRRLSIVLRDLVSDQEAEGKTKKCLTRVWLNPPDRAADMIDWGRSFEGPPEMMSVLHYGAILATFPFAGTVARVIGQGLRTDGRIAASDARAQVRRIVGDRPSVDVAARKSYKTLCNLGILRQEGQGLIQHPDIPTVPLTLAPWIAHSILLTRGAESLPMSSLLAAPELLGLKLPSPVSRKYPHLESHREPDGVVLSEIGSAIPRYTIPRGDR